MAILVSVTATSRTQLTAVFDVAMDALTVRADGWLAAPTGNGVEVSVVHGVLQDGGLNCELTVSPPMSFEAFYDFTADKALTAVGGALAADTANAQATSESLEVDDTAVLGYQAAFIAAVAEELQFLGGMPATRVVDEFLDGDTRLAVESTLSLPTAGAVFYQGRRFAYGSVEPSRLLDVLESPVSVGETIPAGAVVVLDLSSVE